MKSVFIKDIAPGKAIESTFMIKKIVSKGETSITAYVGDITGDIKVTLLDLKQKLKVGDVLNIKGTQGNFFDVQSANRVDSYDIYDYIPKVQRPIEDIMKDIEDISKEEFLSRETKALDDYFFKNEKFLDKFKRGIGGVSQHHNYLGGLAEHTLNVMYLARVFAHRYDIRNKEIAILAAKLHDIGKTEELYYDGPFSYTLRGDMEGHIVIGVSMLEEAFNADPKCYSEDFKTRMKACIIQHHGKQEYGSPKSPNTQEAYVVHLADYTDAIFNKLDIITKDLEPNTWTAYERRIEGRLYF